MASGEMVVRADNLGSPLSLHRAREDHAAGRIDAAELRAVEDDVIIVDVARDFWGE